MHIEGFEQWQNAGSNIPGGGGGWSGAAAPDGSTFAELEEKQRRQSEWRHVNKAESKR